MPVLMGHIWNADCQFYRHDSRRDLLYVRRRNHCVRFGREFRRRVEPRPQRERLVVVPTPLRDLGD
jgi:hypothetical protein